MAIKKQGILAVPGEYKFGDTTEYKEALELRKAAERQPILYLTMGHPEQPGMPRTKDYIGTVTQKWNEKKQRVDGDFWFYEDYISDEFKVKIVNNEPMKISAGYDVGAIEDGIQKDIFYNHIAILRDEEDPKCPLDKCGVNVRMESSSREVRYEQAQDIDEPEEPEKEMVKPAPTLVTFTDEQFEKLLISIRPVVPEPPAEQKPEVKEEVIEEVLEEPSTPPPPEPRMEPEKVIPTAPSPSAEEYATNDDMMAVSIKILGDKVKK